MNKKNKKANKHKAQVLNEVHQFVEAQSQELYSYAIWLCNDEQTAETALEETLDQVINNIHAKTKTKQVNSMFFKALKSNCDAKKPKGPYDPAQNKTNYEQDTLSILIRKTLRKVPERYSEPLVIQALSNLSTKELASFFNVGETEVLMRLSAARKIVSALVSLELSMPQTQIPEVQITPDKCANGLLAGISGHNSVLNNQV